MDCERLSWLDEDVVEHPASAVHADRHAPILQSRREHGAGELKSVDVEREDFSDHITNGEYHGRKSGKYLWKDDLRERLV